MHILTAVGGKLKNPELGMMGHTALSDLELRDSPALRCATMSSLWGTLLTSKLHRERLSGKFKK